DGRVCFTRNVALLANAEIREDLAQYVFHPYGPGHAGEGLRRAAEIIAGHFRGDVERLASGLNGRQGLLKAPPMSLSRDRREVGAGEIPPQPLRDPLVQS